MYANYLVGKEQKDYYGLKLFMGLFILVLILAYTSLYAIQNYYPSSIFSFSKANKNIYFLESKTLNHMYQKKDMDFDTYKKRIEHFEEICDKFGYTSSKVTSDKLTTLDKDSIVLMLDMMALSKKEIDAIDIFVRRGGKILFNFTSGFLTPKLTYQKDNLVTRIANLHLSEKHNTINFKKKSAIYMSTRLLSPVTKYLFEGEGLAVSLYDALPIFHTKEKADAYLTNWAQTHYAQIGKDKELVEEESGVIWHGSRGKGKWVYFSFPSYVFSENSDESYEKLFYGMLSYLDKKISLQIYPYIDVKNGVFISEDTEYKYENLSQFQKVAKKYHFPVTVFCVAKLALEHTSLMKRVGKNSLIDIGSHSYTHKQIVNESDDVYERETIGSKEVLNKFSKAEVIGFRAPREEVDEKLVGLLKDSNYKYILDATDNKLYPYYKDEMLIIPKHATDDYSFLINLDWSSKQILREMKKEVNTIINLDGLYTLSTHTHLMSYGSNIKIVDAFVSYVKKQKHMKALNGTMIFDRVSKCLNINTKSVITDKKMIVTISNDNAKTVENVHYEIVVDPSVHIEYVESEIIGLKTTLTKQNNGKYVLVIKSLKPKSQIVLFVKYVQNN